MISKMRRNLAAGALFSIYGFFRITPRSAALAVSRALGRSAWLIDRSGRRVALNNLERAFGGRMDPARRKRIGIAAYVNMASNLVDLSRLTRLSGDRLSSLVSVGGEAIENLENAAEEGRGVILLTPHLGNWELLAAYLANMGYRVHFVGREPYDLRLEPLFEAVRTWGGASWISRGGAFEKIREALGRGEFVILLPDQDTGRVKGTFVEFFGGSTWTPTGPAVLARLTRSVMTPCALVREEGNCYRLIIEASLDTVRTGEEEYDDWENTRRVSLAIESLVTRYPEQWTWFHRRWRTHTPDGWTSPEPPGDASLLPDSRKVEGRAS